MNQAPRMTAEQVRKIFSYDPITGLLTWREAISGRSKIGEIAGCANKSTGYLQVGVEYRIYLVHRIAWLYMTGKWPAYIDHYNRVRSDNRWSNLRNVSNAENLRNRMEPQSNNKTGFLGVSFRNDIEKFAATIMVDKRTIHLGVYENAELAHKAYLDAKLVYHPGCYFVARGDTKRQIHEACTL